MSAACDTSYTYIRIPTDFRVLNNNNFHPLARLRFPPLPLTPPVRYRFGFFLCMFAYGLPLYRRHYNIICSRCVLNARFGGVRFAAATCPGRGTIAAGQNNSIIYAPVSGGRTEVTSGTCWFDLCAPLRSVQ